MSISNNREWTDQSWAFEAKLKTFDNAGTAVSLAGVFLYSQVKRLSGKKKTA